MNSICFMLTAGLGTRLRPFTQNVPKPALPFLNLPLMNYGFFWAQQAGFKNYLFNTHHLPKKIQSTAETLRSFTSELSFSHESPHILGSGGAIAKARDTLEKYDHFMIANGDEILIPENYDVLANLVEKFHDDQSLCTLLTCDHPELLKTLKPVWVDQQKEVKGFGMERPSHDLKPVHYTGYKIFSKRILDFIPEGESNIFYDILVKAIQSGEKVSTHFIENAHWYETGNFESFLSASQTVATQHWPQLLDIHQFFGKTPRLLKNDQGAVLLPDDQQELDGLNFKGFNAIASGVDWQNHLSIENVFIGPNAHVSLSENLKNTFVF